MDAKGANISRKKSLWDRPVSLFTFISVIVVVSFVAFALGYGLSVYILTADPNWIADFKEWQTQYRARESGIVDNLSNLTRCIP